MSHGINANVVHGWRKSVRQAGVMAINQQREFVPIQLGPPAAQPAPDRDIEVELHRGTLTMKITWPAGAIADFAVWTRELLR